ncbi:L domain-like protein [Linderina pennispora]|uniref:L domain-like protein n=1 Tax=Linderina pennispora TaxID=61395 RepID=A0A1Y1WAC5_9FUNG|nr:L domain-like protein [Linderina pennispora]ORX70268.1 L domain-like protein [Linderina pennispora]
MQADNRAEKREVQRHMWSPYPEHFLTLWAMAPSSDPPPTHLDSIRQQREKKNKRQQHWQLTRDFTKSDSARGKTTSLPAMHRLNLANQSICRLTIPRTAIQYMDYLVELRMPQNNLRELPAALFDLPCLETLNLENNCLENLGHLWPKLKNLRVLFLAGNFIRALPKELGQMERLFFLDVSDNSGLGFLPGDLLDAPALHRLIVDKCSFEMADRLIGEEEWIGIDDAVRGGELESLVAAQCDEIKSHPAAYAAGSMSSRNAQHVVDRFIHRHLHT